MENSEDSDEQKRIDHDESIEITEELIEENIKNVEDGKPLTVPLKKLGQEFKERVGVIEE